MSIFENETGLGCLGDHAGEIIIYGPPKYGDRIRSAINEMRIDDTPHGIFDEIPQRLFPDPTELIWAKVIRMSWGVGILWMNFDTELVRAYIKDPYMVMKTWIDSYGLFDGKFRLCAMQGKYNRL